MKQRTITMTTTRPQEKTHKKTEQNPPGAILSLRHPRHRHRHELRHLRRERQRQILAAGRRANRHARRQRRQRRRRRRLQRAGRRNQSQQPQHPRLLPRPIRPRRRSAPTRQRRHLHHPDLGRQPDTRAPLHWHPHPCRSRAGARRGAGALHLPRRTYPGRPPRPQRRQTPPQSVARLPADAGAARPRRGVRGARARKRQTLRRSAAVPATRQRRRTERHRLAPGLPLRPAHEIRQKRG